MSQGFTRDAFGASMIAIAVCALPQTASSQESEGAQTVDERKDHQLELEVLHQRLADLEARDSASQARISMLEERLFQIEAQPLGIDDMASYRGRYQPPSGSARSVDPALAYFQQPPSATGGAAVLAEAPDTEEERLKEPGKAEVVAEVTDQQQGRFGSRLGFELGLGYTHFGDARINLDGFLALDAIFLGTISIDQVNADIVTLDPTVRLGLSDRFFLDASVPFLARSSNFQSGGAGGAAGQLIEATVSDRGFGDASIGASYRLLEETQNRPDLVMSVRAKFPTGRHPFGIEFVEVANSEGNLEVPVSLATGSGVYGGSAGVSLLKTLDPMVVFGNVTYFHNFSRSFSDLDENPEDQPGRVNVGNALQYGAGLAFALNDRSSLSMSYSQRFVERTRIRPEGQDWRALVGSQANVALVNLGATFTLTDAVSLITNVGIGLTDDSPDMTVNLRVPFSF